MKFVTEENELSQWLLFDLSIHYNIKGEYIVQRVYIKQIEVFNYSHSQN